MKNALPSGQEHHLEDPAQMQAAVHAYRDIKTGKQWHRVDVHFCPVRAAYYFLVQEKEEDRTDCVLPLPLTAKVSLERMEEYFDGINTNEKDLTLSRLTLALVDSDSTIAYYHIYRGIQEPPIGPLSQQRTS